MCVIVWRRDLQSSSHDHMVVDLRPNDHHVHHVCHATQWVVQVDLKRVMPGFNELIFFQAAGIVTPLHPAWHNWLARETFTIVVISRLRVRASPWESTFCNFFAFYIKLRTTS